MKHFGVIKNWKSGYVRCTLCPIDLGAPGFWFTNEIKVQKLREHFQVNYRFFVGANVNESS